MRHRLNQLLVVTILVVIVVLSVMPVAPPQPGTGPTIPWSMIFHGGMYFLLAGSLLLVFHETGHTHFMALLVAAGIGAVLELVQWTIAFRSFSLLDMTVNTIGASMIMFDHHLDVVTMIIRFEERLITAVFPD